MAIFKWTDALSVGVDEMDGEHKLLITIMNNLQLKCDNGRPKTEIEAVLEELIQFTKKHFQDEESFMSSIQYPELEKHRRAHVVFFSRLETEQRKFKDSEQLTPGDGFFAFLQFWLKAHIQGNDSKYGFFSRQQTKH
jgi:hemerythrin-like metal-binding protein